MDLLGPMNVSHNWDGVGEVLGLVASGLTSEATSEEGEASACPHCKQKFAAPGFSCEQEGQGRIVLGYSITTTPTQAPSGSKRSLNNIGLLPCQT